MKTENVTRRFFIGGLASFGAFGGCRAFGVSAGSASSVKPNLRFGVVSDIHLQMGPGFVLANGFNADTLVSAFEWFRDSGADAVMIPGDLADSGIFPELEALAETWRKVFPDDKAPDGRRVERLFVYGNHDWDAWTYKKSVEQVFPDEAERKRNLIGLDQKKFWEKAFHEPYSPIWRKEVKGYSFVGANWANAPCVGYKGLDEEGIAGVSDFFAKTGPFDPSRPFFYFQHPHPKSTCYGSWAWGHDNGESTRALSKFPNAVAFSGHSHYSLTDERSIWQEGGLTALSVPSMSYTGLPTGYENGYAVRDTTSAMSMERIQVRENLKEAQGFLLTVGEHAMRSARGRARRKRRASRRARR